MQQPIHIRPATPDDAEVAALLLYSAYTHTQLQSAPTDEAASGFVERLRQAFPRKQNRFSYQCACVATAGKSVVGLELSFGGREEAQLNAAVGSWLAREARDDEWYVDALAVLIDWGRQGIGARLMQAAEDAARQQHYATMALNVAVENTPALQLYQHLGYVTAAQTSIYGQPHLKMVKPL